MSFVSPMLARKMPDYFDRMFEPNQWWANEKFDGIRLITVVRRGASDLFTEKTVETWSRLGIIHPVPRHIIEAAAKLPDGIYDGELLAPGKRCYGTMALVNGPDLLYHVFDIIEAGGFSFIHRPLEERLIYMQELEQKGHFSGPIKLAEYRMMSSWADVEALRDRVYERDGEGLILKRVRSKYQVGKRPKDWIKIKKLERKPMMIVGFQPSRGLLNNRGPYAIVVVRDEDGIETTVKTKNDAECRQFEMEATVSPHPAIGRMLIIEYQERTPDGNYREPRWKEWA